MDAKYTREQEHELGRGRRVASGWRSRMRGERGHGVTKGKRSKIEKKKKKVN